MTETSNMTGSTPSLPGIDFNKLNNNIRMVLTDPKGAWGKLTSEYATDKDFIVGYVAPLALIPVVFSFIQMVFIGNSIPGFPSYKAPFFSSLVYAIVQFAVSLVMVFVAAFVINKVASFFKGTPVHAKSLRLVGYSSTAANVASVFTILPGLGMILQIIAGIYGIYTFWCGTPEMTGVPKEQRLLFIISTAVAMFVVALVLGAVMAIVTPRMM